MSLLQQLSILAVHQILGDRAQSLMHFFNDRAGDQSRRLYDILRHSSERAWRCLEVALAGPSWWGSCTGMFRSAEERNMQRQIEAFLRAVPVTDLPGDPEKFRKLALTELHSARRVGLVPGPDFRGDELVESVRGFEAFTDPKQLLERDRVAVSGMADVLRKEKYTHLAAYIALRPGQGQPLLIQAVRFFFRADVAKDEQLSTGLMLDRLENIDGVLQAGFAEFGAAFKEHGVKLEGLLGNLAQIASETLDIVSDTHDDVKLLRSEMERQSDEIRQLTSMLKQMLDQKQPAPVVPVAEPVVPIAQPVVVVEKVKPAPAIPTIPPAHPTVWDQVRSVLARASKEPAKQPELARVAQQLANATQAFESTQREYLSLQTGQASKDVPILDALPADEPVKLPVVQPEARAKYISPIFLQGAKPTQEPVAAAEPPPAEEPAKPTEPKKRRLISPLFDQKRPDQT